MPSSNCDEKTKRKTRIHKQVAVFRKLATENEETVKSLFRKGYYPVRYLFGKTGRTSRSDVFYN